jgi:hypothetical protein
MANKELADRHMESFIHAAERTFVEGAYIPVLCLETMRSVHFAMQRRRSTMEKL